MSDELRERDQLEVGSHGITLVSLLGTARSSRTWLAVDASGDGLCVVRRIAGMSPAAQAPRLLTLTVAQALRHPCLLSPSQAWADGGAIWVARPHDPGVSLRRLMAVARLTPAQVAMVGQDVLAGLGAIHAAGLAHGNLHPGNILLGSRGTARITDSGLAPELRPDGCPAVRGDPSPAGDPRDDLEAAAAALRTALGPAGRRGAPSASAPTSAPELIEVLGTPGEAFAGAATAVEARAALEPMVGEAAYMLHRQLAALAAPLRGERLGATLRQLISPAPPARRVSPARPAAPGAGAVAIRRVRAAVAISGDWLRTAAARVPSRRPLTSGFSSRRLRPPSLSSRRALLWVLPVVAAVVITGVGLALGAGPTLSGPQRVQGRAAPTVAATPGPPTPQALPPSARPTPAVVAHPGAPAPPTAGGIAGLSVSLAGASGCTATTGTSCLLTVRVQLTPPPALETVAWSFVAVNRCSGVSSTLPGASVAAGPGYQYVWADSQLTFQGNGPLMLYAVTIAPARASSAGLLVRGGAAGC